MVETTDPERIASLRSISLFAECSDESLRQVLDLATEFEVQRGYVLIQPDQPGTGLFVIEDGTVTVEGPRGEIVLGPGEVVGELAILDEHAVRSTRVTAASNVRGLAIRREDFERLLESEPKMALTLLRVLARRLAAVVHRGA